MSDEKIGRKFDMGKHPVHQGIIAYFPRALYAVGQVSEYGAIKYEWENWHLLKDAISRYANAKARHMLDAEIDGPFDPTTNLIHLAQEGWNLLAVLELKLRNGELKLRDIIPPKDGGWLETHTPINHMRL